MDPHLRALAASQVDVVAAWQLRRAGWSRWQVQHHAERGGWRSLHRGVYLLTSSPPTRRQLWYAATLTTPDSRLSHGSGGACYGFHRFQRGYEVVTRPGRGGRRRHGGVLVFRSDLPDDEVTEHHGIPITTAARVLLDLAPGLNEKQLGRAFRESIRLKCTTARRVLETAQRHQGQPGTRLLHELATRYARIPYQRTRSDAEGRALEILHDAGVGGYRVNVKVAGEEADLVSTERQRIVEIDGPQYHQFADEDARKAEIWRKAGYEVRRVPSGAVYDDPARLIAACV
jgi:very-short-patch-repair endonuclease